MVDEDVVVVDLVAEGVDIAHRARRWWQVVVGIDVEFVDEGSRGAVIVDEDDGEAPLA